MFCKIKTFNLIIFFNLIAFMAASVYSVNKPTLLNKKTTEINNTKLIVYYFITSYRCKTCLFIEENTKTAIESTFSNELKNGSIEFKMVNIEEKQNQHFVDEYGIYTKSVILSDLKDGKQKRWKNLDKIWEKVGDKTNFKEYIVKEIKTYCGI